MNRSECGKEADHPLLTKVPHDCVPFLELDIYRDGDPSPSRLDDIPSPRLLSTHVAYTSLPRSIIESGCKIIYIYRDPKDVLVSFWHFLPKALSPPMSNNNKVSNACDLFCKGYCSNGSYWDHILSYWKANIECPQRFLFLKYEDLKREPHLYTRKLAEFVGQPFSLQEEEEERRVHHIVDLCSFESLSNMQVSKKGIFQAQKVANDAFYRKGDIGDWKNHFTPDIADRFDEITKHKFHGYDLAL